ncbi:MAG: hypothetical protein AB1640_16195 [bacterium]
MNRSFVPGDLVATTQGQLGMVLSRADLEKARSRCREGKRPGHFFAPGCCARPDYVTQVPVLFEDGSYDIMRAVNLRKSAGLTAETKRRFEEML